MFAAHLRLFLLLLLRSTLILAQYTATYNPLNLPAVSQQGQTGTNACGTSASQSSQCQNVFVNSVNDFCLWGPPSTSSSLGDGTSKIGNVEEIVVSYCLNDGYGTRLIPSGTITNAHFVKVETPDVSYVQVTGSGDFTKINIPAGDNGGELDPHSWTGLGNPQGGLTFTNAFSGQWEEAHEWTSFISATDFCIRLCRDGPNAAGWCQHIYDELGCSFTIPGSFDSGFDNCLGDVAQEPGVYSSSTFYQGDATTPPSPNPAPTSQCTQFNTIGGGSIDINAIAAVVSTTASPITMSTSASISSSVSITSSFAITSSVSGSLSSGSSVSSGIVSATSMLVSISTSNSVALSTKLASDSITTSSSMTKMNSIASGISSKASGIAVAASSSSSAKVSGVEASFNITWDILAVAFAGVVATNFFCVRA